MHSLVKISFGMENKEHWVSRKWVHVSLY